MAVALIKPEARRRVYWTNVSGDTEVLVGHRARAALQHCCEILARRPAFRITLLHHPIFLFLNNAPGAHCHFPVDVSSYKWLYIALRTSSTFLGLLYRTVYPNAEEDTDEIQSAANDCLCAAFVCHVDCGSAWVPSGRVWRAKVRRVARRRPTNSFHLPVTSRCRLLLC